jgi:hypothetical protein
LVLRGSDRQAVGFVLLLALDRVTDEDEQIDPPVAAVYRYLQRQTPLRRGETATFFRFWMARDDYQAVSPVQSQLFIIMVRHYLTTPGLISTFLPCRAPDFWAPMFTYADLARLPDLDFTTTGRPYGVYGHDWRAMPPLAWLSLMGEREVGTTSAPPTPPTRIIALDEGKFATAVHEALKQITQPLALHQSPLLHSRLVADRVGLHAADAARIRALQAVIYEAAEALRASPKEQRFYRVLHHTYFQPAPTQERAAELLDLPFSTYRRHLKTAVERMVELLWQREIQGR